MRVNNENDLFEKNKYFEQTKYIINPNIHKFIYALVKYLIFGKDKMRHLREKLKKIITKLNIKGLGEDELLQNKCNIQTLKILFNYVKTQNFSLATEIFENILIRVFSFAFKAKNDEFFGKYIYNNLEILKTNKKIFINWINNGLLTSLFNEDNQDLKESLETDVKLLNLENDKKEETFQLYQLYKKSTFLHILLYIFLSKKIINNKKENSNLDTTTTCGDSTSIYTQISELFYGDLVLGIGHKNKDQPLTLSSSILISAYICYQNRKSPLIEYSEPKNNLENLPFVYDLSEAGINDLYSNSILNPIRIEPGITDIEVNKNTFKEYGMFELHKLLMFNKNIKKISLSSCRTNPLSLNTFNENFVQFDNNNLEELNMSSNYLKSDVDTNLSILISHLKGLKSLALSNNALKSGLGSFFVNLKNLYRKNQSKLEDLYLVNCELDDISFYELGELLKSKYCKLKCLCLNENKIPSDVNFFKALKKNRSLEEIYFYGCRINSEKTNEIERIISNTNLQALHLNLNNIHNFNQYIRIIYKTCLIKNSEEKKSNNIFTNKPALYNLNLNNDVCYNQNSEKLKILLEIFENTNLSILDLNSVIFAPNIEENKINYNYYKQIMKIHEYLKEKQEEYKSALREIITCNANIKKFNKLYKNIDKKDIEKYNSNKDILNIINDEYCQKVGQIKEKISELIQSSSFNKDKSKEIENYIHLNKALKKLRENNRIKELKKLIII